MKTMGLVLLFGAVCTYGSQAQDYCTRGWCWNGNTWVWRGGDLPSRRMPPGPAYDYPSGNNCYGQQCVDEFHRFGGRDQRTCYDSLGYVVPCR